MDERLQKATIRTFRMPNEAVVSFENTMLTDESLEELEADMLNEVRHSLHHELGRSNPRLYQEVMLFNNARTTCRRGYILEILPSDIKTTYTVFLCDHGLSLKNQLGCNIMRLKERFLTFPPRMCILRIPGILPSKLAVTDIHGMALNKPYQPEYVKGDDWSPPALQWAQEWAKNHEKRTRVSVMREIDRIVKIGELFAVDLKGKILRKSFQTLICSENLAVFSAKKHMQDVKPNIQTAENWQTRAQRFGGLLPDAAASKTKTEPNSTLCHPVEKSCETKETVNSKFEEDDDNEWDVLISIEEKSLFDCMEDTRKVDGLNSTSELFRSEFSKMSAHPVDKFSRERNKQSNPFYKHEYPLTDDVLQKETTNENVNLSHTSVEVNASEDSSSPQKDLNSTNGKNLFSRKNQDNCFENKQVYSEDHSQVILIPDHVHHDRQDKHHISMKDAVAEMSLAVREKPDCVKEEALCGTMIKSENQIIRNSYSPTQFSGKETTPLDLARMKRSPQVECQESKVILPIYRATYEGRHRYHPPDANRNHTASKFGFGRHDGAMPFRQQCQTPDQVELGPVQRILRDRNKGDAEMEKYSRSSNLSNKPAEEIDNMKPSLTPAKPKFKVTLPYTWDEVVKSHSRSNSSGSPSSEDSSARPSCVDKSKFPQHVSSKSPTSINPFHPPPNNGQPGRINPFKSPTSRFSQTSDDASKNIDSRAASCSDRKLESLAQSPTAKEKNSLMQDSERGEHLEMGAEVKLKQQHEHDNNRPREATHTSCFDTKTLIKEISPSCSVPKGEITPLTISTDKSTYESFPFTGKNQVMSPSTTKKTEKGQVEGTCRVGSDTVVASKPMIPTAEGKVVYQRSAKSSAFSSEGASMRRTTKDRVFVYGNSPVTPYSGNEFQHVEIIKQAIQQNFLKKFNSLQQHVIPNILRGRNVFILDNDYGGKSLAYMIPIVAKIMRDTTYGEKVGRGPRAVIVSSSLSSCLNLDGHMQFLLDSVQQRRTVGYCVTQNDDNTKHDLKSGIDIMITTPELLLEMMDKYLPYIALDRLMYLVVDDLEILTNTKIQVLHDVLKQIEVGLTKLGHRACPFQTVFVGNVWNEFIESATHMVDSPVMVIGPIQATVFAGVKTVVHFSQDEDDKLAQFLDLIGKIMSTPTVNNRIIVVCQDNESVKLIEKAIWEKFKWSVLTAMHASATDADEDVSPGQVEGVRHRWKNASLCTLQIVVCTDAVIRELQITDALQLIHFDVPENNTRYAQRYCTMWSWFRSPQHRKENPSDTKEIASNLFLTSNQKSLTNIIRKLKEQNCQMSNDLEKHFQNLRKEEETKSRFCPGLIWHGLCEQLDPLKCVHRHEALPHDNDPSPMIPKTGQIEVHIATTHNPSSYYAQLLRHFEITGRGKTELVCNYSKELLHRTNFLENFYKDEDNRVRPEKMDKDTYVAAEVDGKYVRAQVEGILKRDAFGLPLFVHLFCLDTAMHITRAVNIDELYVLPTGYDTLPNFGIELVLANMKPTMGERCFRRDHVGKVSQLATDAVLFGRICLSIGNRIWVDQLVEMTTNADGKMYQKRSLRQQYFRRKYAENNGAHMETLYEIFRKVGMSCKEYKDIKILDFDPEFVDKFFQEGDPIQWAHIEVSDKENPLSVTVWSSFSDDVEVIFCYHETFTTQLDCLNDDLHEEIEKLQGKKSSNQLAPLEKYFKVGIVVAAKDDDQRWIRAIIDYVHYDESDILCDIFLVDTGEYKCRISTNDLFPIPKKFVTKLPFQAIALKMSHIVPASFGVDGKEATWTPEAKDFLFDKLFREDNAQMLDIVAFSKNEPCEYPPCNYYNAIIFNSACPNVEIGEQMVEEEHAQFVDNGKVLLETAKEKRLQEGKKRKNEYNQDNVRETVDESDDKSNKLLGPNLDNLDDPDRWDVFYGADQDPLKILMGENNHFENYTQDVMRNVAHQSVPPKHSPMVSLPSASTMSDDTAKCDSHTPSGEKPLSPMILHEADSKSLEPILRKPQTVWKQFNGDIVLRINIPDVQEYKADVSDDRKSFCFESLDPSGYGFRIRLFKRVEKSVDVKRLGSYTKIKLKKRMNTIEWTRLTESETRPHWIVKDYDDISSEDNSDQDFEDSNSSSNEDLSVVPLAPTRRKNKKQTRKFVNVHYNDNESSDSDFLQDAEDELTQYLE